MSLHDEIVAAEVEGRQIAMIKLAPLAHELGAGLLIEREGLVGGRRLLATGIVILQQRLETVRPLTVGPACELHLEKSQVDSHLDLFRSIIPHDEANLDLVRIEVPAGEN